MESAERPWGSWHVLDEGSGYKVKRLEVHPHQRLSYQTHEQRSEHWTVVLGTATCLLDGETVVIANGEALDVPIGPYLGEDDIVRLEDDYGRIDAQ